MSQINILLPPFFCSPDATLCKITNADVRFDEKSFDERTQS